MSHCCREIYCARYQHRKSRSLGANGRCFAYCGIFSYHALSLPARSAQAGGTLSSAARLPASFACPFASGSPLAEAGAAQSPGQPCSLKTAVWVQVRVSVSPAEPAAWLKAAAQLAWPGTALHIQSIWVSTAAFNRE